MAGEGKSAITAAIIGGIFAVIAAIITVIGISMNLKTEISATQTAEAVRETKMAVVGEMKVQSTDTPRPAAEAPKTEPTPLPTYTPYPTYTQPPSGGGQVAPPEPTATTAAKPPVTEPEQPIVQQQPTDTPPGTVLQVGETWISNGLYVQLKDIEFLFGDEADLQFYFTNQTNRTINLSINHDVHVTMRDDKGNLYTWASPYQKEASINPGQTWFDEVYKGGKISQAGYFIIELNIPGVIQATWKY